MTENCILASRSPRRLELLSRLVPAERITVRPPRSTDEAGFEDCRTRREIDERLSAIARTKCDDVVSQLQAERLPETAIVIAADTTIIATDAQGRPSVLGQPPEDERWAETVRRWFRDYYFGRTHQAATALCLATLSGRRLERIVTTHVTFHADGERWLDWYLATGESRGKAGGYAIQGLAEIFVARVDGSLSNVIGLPLRDLCEVLEALGYPRRARISR